MFAAPSTPASINVSAGTMVVDTSFWISWFLRTDANHAIAVAWLNKHLQGGGSLLSPTMLAIETASGVARVTNLAALGTQAASELYTIPFIQIVPMDQNLVNETTAVAAQFMLRGADAVFVALAKINSIPLVSFDNEQLTRPTAIISTVRP
ncbi:MAG TPA: PIN domain-containing protein [Chloroflexia bacterium]|nr:PIN domain-containing protein [Chloroflexia bacterium]